MRKGEIACNKQFLLFSQCVLSCMALIFHSECTLQCRLQFLSFWTNIKFCHLVIGLCIIPSFNLLPHMAILGSSNSAANKDMMSKI